MGIDQKNIGSSFEDFLEEEGILEEVTAAAIKRVLAFQIEKEMKRRNLSKSEMARKMKTSRASVNRLLDPENDAVTLKTLTSAAMVLGKKITVELS